MMFEAWCLAGNWASFGNFGVWDWVGLLFSLILLVVWAARRARVTLALEQPTAKGILQTRYVREEITREQYQQMLVDMK
jgi:uncharacterized membrane protein